MVTTLPQSIQATLTNIINMLIIDTVDQKDNSTTTTPTNTISENTTNDTNTDITNEDTTIDDSTLDIDSLFPTESDIEIQTDSITSLVDVVTDIYNEDKIALKKDYISKLNLSIQSYIQQMLAITNQVPLPDYSYLLKNYDGDAVSVSGDNNKHLHDTIIKLQKVVEEESRLFDKTHSADTILSVYRSMLASYQQRKRYYGENYNTNNL